MTDHLRRPAKARKAGVPKAASAMQSLSDHLKRNLEAFGERDAEKRRATISRGLATLSGRKRMDELPQTRIDHTSDVAVF
jgi:hypothetical protein